MANTKIRDYEVSIWSLQDDFIAVLKTAYVENKGQITEPKLKLSTDGTQELSFSIPMYMYQDGVRVANPAWYNTKNGNLIINMRKIKVILNKYTDDEGIFDFMITKVTERHETDELYCDVTCEGLAFSELGKVGYKISLSSEDFYNEDYEWFVDERPEAEKGPEPQATLDYWLRKFLQPYDETQVQDAHTWYYEVRMDWSAFKGGNKRESSKVYEEPYVSAWDEQLAPKKVENYKEKARMIDLQESNIYNLTQDIAKTFGVFCRYEYQYDMNYHIIGRKIVFYNNYMQEKEGYISLTYPYDTDNITREIDSGDTITKLFVKSVNNDASISGLSTIMDVQANKSLEDYILNFDYCHKTGAITEAQYQEIEKYEKTLRNINTTLIPLLQQIENIEKQLPEVEASITVSGNAISLDEERLGNADRLFKELDSSDGKPDGVLSVSIDNPITAVPMKDTSANNGSYYFNIKETGVIPDSLKIYKTIDYTKTGENRLSDQIKTGVAAYDEFGNLNKITNIWFSDSERSKILYLVYDYNHKTYYQKVVATWTSRLEKDRAANAEAQEKHSKLQEDLNKLKKTRDNLLSEQRQCRADFEKYMGPALREGYWQPEDFNDYGENFNEAFKIPVEDPDETENTEQPLTEFIWDTDLFEEEQKGYYESGVDQQQYPYPIIKLNNTCLTALNTQKWQDINLIFKNTTDSDEWNFSNIKCYALGSQLQLVFIKDNEQYTPALLVTGAELLTNDELAAMKSTGRLGSINIKDDHTPEIKTYYTIKSKKDWIASETVQNVYYPRVQINSVFLKATGDQIALKYNGTVLNNYEDYSILFRDGVFLLSLKPLAILKNTNSWETERQLQVKFSLSNADISIYLDALQVAQENSQPKVSYEVTPSGLNKDFIYNDYTKLARIVNINDTDLKFENVQGYISELELDLAEPWNDSVTIKNYKTKFEDLFSTIVAQTEAMKKSEYTIGLASNLFMSDGQLSGEVVKNSLSKVNLDYAFNNGKLTIDDKNGIIGLSDAGVVAMRGGGIFTATEKDASGNWIWNTGIVPQGINADLITTGQLDTNRIKIYAGDRAQFQLNSTGLYAYRTFLQDYSVNSNVATALKDTIDAQATVDGYDPAQYIVFNSDGLTLRLNDGALVLDSTRTGFVTIAKGGVDKVKLSWDGLTLRNNEGKTTLSMDPEDGNLYLAGTVYANRFSILANEDANKNSAQSFTEYVAGVTKDKVAAAMKAYKDTENTAWVNNTLKAVFDEAGTILKEGLTEVPTTTPLTDISLNDFTTNILGGFLEKIKNTTPTEFSGDDKPTNFKPGDIWQKDSNTTYLAMDFSTKVDSSNDSVSEGIYSGWNRIYDGTIKSITGTRLDVNANNGTIAIKAGGTIDIAAEASVTIASNNVQITGNNAVNIGGKTISIGGSAINFVAADLSEGVGFASTIGTASFKDSNNNTIASSNLQTAMSLSSQGIELTGATIKLAAGNSSDTSILSLKSKEIILGTVTTQNEVITLDSGLLMNPEQIQLKTGGSQINLKPAELTLGVVVGDYLNGGIQIGQKTLLLRADTTQFYMSENGLEIGTFNQKDSEDKDDPEQPTATLKLTNNSFYLKASSVITQISKGAMVLVAESASPDALNDNWTNAMKAPTTLDGKIKITSGNALSGVKISNNGIWLEAIGNQKIGLVKITPSQVLIGQASNTGLSGSFIDLSDNKIRIGSSTDIEIGATNIGLYTADGKETASITNKDTTTSYSNVHFRLGEPNNPKLLFANGDLIIKGRIIASSMQIAGETEYGDSGTSLDAAIAEAVAQGEAKGAAAGAAEVKQITKDTIIQEVNDYIGPDIGGAVNAYLNKNGYQRGQHVYVGPNIPGDAYKKDDLWYQGDQIKQAIADRNEDESQRENDWTLIGRQSGTKTFVSAQTPSETLAPGDIWYHIQQDGSIIPKKYTESKQWVSLILTANTDATIFTSDPHNSIYKQNDIWYEIISNNKVITHKAIRDSDPWQLLAAQEQGGIVEGAGEPTSQTQVSLYYIDTTNHKAYQYGTNTWQTGVSIQHSSTSAPTSRYAENDYWYDTDNKILYQAKYSTPSDTDDNWIVITNLGVQTFTSKPANDTNVNDGDILYETSSDGQVIIKKYNASSSATDKWEPVALPIADGATTYYNENPDVLPARDYHTGDVWYAKQEDGTYIIYRAKSDYETKQNYTDAKYISEDWDIINLPYGNGAQHLFYDAGFPTAATSNVNANDILYQPSSDANSAGFNLYVAGSYTPWKENYLQQGNIITKTNSATQTISQGTKQVSIRAYQYHKNDFRYISHHLYQCIQDIPTDLPDDEVISYTDTAYWTDLGQVNLSWTTTEPTSYNAGAYWVPVASNTYISQTLYDTSVSSQALIGTKTVDGQNITLYWLPYSYPEIKGAMMEADADTGIIKINATDEINIIATPKVNSFNNIAGEGGTINIKGVNINIEANSSLRFGYTETLDTDGQSKLHSGVLIDRNGIRMYSQADLIMSAGHKIQISGAGVSGNFIRFGSRTVASDQKVYDSTTEISDTQIRATTANFSDCYVKGSRVLTEDLMTHPVLYTSSNKKPGVPPGHTFAIWLHPFDEYDPYKYGTRTYQSTNTSITEYSTQVLPATNGFTATFSGDPNTNDIAQVPEKYNKLVGKTFNIAFFVTCPLLPNNSTHSYYIKATSFGGNKSFQTTVAFSSSSTPYPVTFSAPLTLEESEAFGSVTLTACPTTSSDIYNIYLYSSVAVSLVQIYDDPTRDKTIVPLTASLIT